MDTRSTGGAVQPGTTREVDLGGVGSVPTSGVSAIAVTLTVVSATGPGTLAIQPFDQTATPTTTALAFQTGETVSNTALVAVSSDVKAKLSVSVATDVVVDVTGYFASGNGKVTPGGYVPNTLGGERAADTNQSGTGIRQGAVTGGQDVTVNLAGRAQVPDTATAVFANITIVATSGDTLRCYFTPYPTGSAVPTDSLNFVAGVSTGLGTVVDINSNQQFNIKMASCGQQGVRVVVDVQGYYDSSPNKGAFTPGTGRVYDSTTSTSLRFGAGTTREIQVAGTAGVPSASTGIAALAVEITAAAQPVSGATTSNYVEIWANGQTEPSANVISIVGQAKRSNMATIVPGATTNTVFVKNNGNADIDLTFDVEGWYNTAGNLPTASGSNCAASGQRPTSHQIPHQLTDRASMSWNPVNGNLNLREPLIHLTGAGQSIDFGLRYNSLNDTRPTFTAGWVESSLAVNPVANTVTFTDTDGACYVFGSPTTSGTTTTYATPPYINATLTYDTTNKVYKLRRNPSGVTATYKDVADDGTASSVWQLTNTVDSTGGNAIRYTYDTRNRIATIAEDNAPSRKLNFAYLDTNNQLQPSKVTDASLSRVATFTYAGPSGAMDTVTDAAGDKLTFGYTAAASEAVPQITSILDNNTTNNLETNGPGHTTTITYDSSRRVATWTYANVTTATTASTYTASYPHDTQTTTTLTDALHPATTFAFDHDTAANGRAPAGIGTAVVTITDPLGHATNYDYNPHGDVEKTTNALGQAASSTYGGANYLVNSGTAAGSGTGGTTPGASTFLNYPGDDRNTTAKDQDGNNVPACTAASSPGLGNYRPCSSTDAQGHVSGYTYDSVSQNVNQVTTSGSAGGTQTFTYQDDAAGNHCTNAKSGQICSATDGDGGTHKTTFAYNARGDLITIDRPAGLGDIAMTYDAAGRIASRTDGAGNTSYYGYDNDDRPTQVTVNTTTCTFDATGSCVQYFYDNAGNLLLRGDRVGPTYYTFDQQNRLIEKKNTTDGGNTITADTLATYDAVGNRTSTSDQTYSGRQTTTYGYDVANRNAWLGEPGTTSCPVISVAQSATTAGCVLFLYDAANRRTDTYLPNGRDNHVDYDTNGRPSYLDNRPYGGNSYGATAGRSYAYTSGPKSAGSNTAGGMVSATGTASGSYSSYYTYDGMNHLKDQGAAANPTDNVASAYWHYDHNGNRTQATTTGGGGTTTYATYNDANQLCWTGPTGTDTSTCGGPTSGSTSYTYDAAGNLTGSGPLSAPADHTYGYSIYDQLVTTVVGGTTTGYGYNDVTSDERTQAGTAAIDNGMNGVNYVEDGTNRIEYLRDAAGTLIEMRTKIGTGAWTAQYYSLDRLGSVILLTDTTGATTAAPTYDAWGVTTSAAPTNSAALLNRFGYASGYTDPGTGLIKYGTRYYIPTLGVWTQADPASQGANFYIYAGDDPITNTDPTGRDSSDVSGSACAYFFCLDAGVTTDDDGDEHFHIGAGPSTDEFGADLSLTDSSDDGESGAYVSASCSAGGYTAGVSADEGGFSGQGGVDIGTGDAEPGCDAEAGYEF